MKYKIHYYCISDRGKCRHSNQDAYICNKTCNLNDDIIYPIQGHAYTKKMSIMGVFDGMGGEECGETAARLAAENAMKMECGDDPIDDMIMYCRETNKEILSYAQNNNIRSMGTTVAMLIFTDKKIYLCNVGDSRIYRYAKGKLEQISYDHSSVAAYGIKPPLYQYLGMNDDETIIDPYIAEGRYNAGDIYLICSDGLTDMVTDSDIEKIIEKNEFENIAGSLFKKAIDNGGKDNITLIICKVDIDRLICIRKNKCGGK